ncbi:MAG: helix-hairpin-helix domain-containing protein [Verrucomicrobiae bacterium]|nr:helix-hairpin-helix domain-containing protein [Verrucomicrobiae bacterium]
MKRFRYIWAIGLLAVTALAVEWQTFKDCRWVEHRGNDGDSFRVVCGERELHVRLYFVDCPETVVVTDADAKRIREQARYFGLTNMQRVVHFGREAREFTARLLAEPFTVHTAFADAMGRSAEPRVYALVTTHDGRDLGTELVRSGLARAFGAKRTTPDGRSGDRVMADLQDLERQAMLQRAGIWAETAADLLAELRAQQRSEDEQLEGIRVALRDEPPSEPVDLNRATSRQLQAIPGIGPVLAERIVSHRPYERVEDLLRVPGIGERLFQRIKPYVVVMHRAGVPAEESP